MCMWSQLLPATAEILCVIDNGFAKPKFFIIFLALVAARYRYALCYSYRYASCYRCSSTPATATAIRDATAAPGRRLADEDDPRRTTAARV